MTWGCLEMIRVMQLRQEQSERGSYGVVIAMSGNIGAVTCVGTVNGKTPTGGFYCERCPRVSSHFPHAPQTSPPKTLAVPEYPPPPSERPSYSERLRTSSKTQPTMSRSSKVFAAFFPTAPSVL